MAISEGSPPAFDFDTGYLASRRAALESAPKITEVISKKPDIKLNFFARGFVQIAKLLSTLKK